MKNDRKVNHVSYEHKTDNDGSPSGLGVGLSPLPQPSRHLPPLPQAFGAPGLYIIHFAFGIQSTHFQIHGLMDGHYYANSLFPLQNVPENHIFPSFLSAILNAQIQVNFSNYT